MKIILFPLLIAAAAAADLSQQGAAAMRAGRFEEAERIYRELVKASPEDPGFHLNLGLALYSGGKYGQALPELQVYLKANPKSGPVYLVAGTAQLKLGRFCDAVPTLEKARSWQASTKVFTELADAYHGCKRYLEAARLYEKVKEFRAAARAYWQAREYALARPLYEASKTDDPEWLYEYGDTLVRIEGAAAGLPYLARSVELQPDLLPARGALGRALLELGRAEESIPHLAAAAPTDVTLLMPLSRAYKATGRLEEAARVEQEYRKKLSGQN
jgi:tetratricopeptide (TPR) repeat protein